MDALISTLFLGAVFGCIYALLAYGLVLTFRTSGVFNFAQGALGMFFAYVYFQLQQGGSMNLVVGVYDMRWHLPVGIALPLVLLVLAPLFGALLEAALFRKLRDAGAVVQIVATIRLLVSSFAALAGILIVPFFGSLDTTTLTFLVVAATAGAVLGKLESLPLTLAGAVGVGIAQLLAQKYIHGELGRELRPSIPFLVLF